jgi:eukaryotic-like serine/threonine-protein kinase
MSDGIWVSVGTLTLPYGTVRTLHEGASEVRLYSCALTQSHRVGKRVSLLGREDNLAANEARFLSSISHRNIAEVFDVAEPAGMDSALNIIEILMPYYERGSVYDAMVQRGERFRPSEARDLTVRALRGLTHLHQKERVLHRDVKPGNLFLTGDDSQIKLGDFGEAMVMDSSGQCDPLLSPQFWTPPEAFIGSRYSVQSELYALGMSMREMLSGPMPHDDYTREDLARRLAVGQHPVKGRDLGFQPHIPESLRRVARKATRRLPVDRYNSAEAMIRDLLHAKFIDWNWPTEVDGELTWSGTGGGDSYRVVARPVRGKGWRARAERHYPSGWRRVPQVPDADSPDPASAAAEALAAMDRQFTSD